MFPLVPGLRALRDRGHEIHLRIGARLVDGPWADGLNIAPTDPRIDEIEVKADAGGTGPAQLRRALAGLMSRGPLERADLDRAVAQVDPDVILVDTNAYGAAIAARASGRPWGIVLPSLVALPGRGIPPYGLGLAPARGPLGRLRDRVVWPLVIRQFGAAMLPPPPGPPPDGEGRVGRRSGRSTLTTIVSHDPTRSLRRPCHRAARWGRPGIRRLRA
ncbi:hypothetical protein [Parafrankia discariae]|uniref:hypothetical protein n=1 Tax=Parafrankia discariae TaxID=365528 RepID=UPI00037A9A80|nr:hypothetical protein [Parafrankia discariae]